MTKEVEKVKEPPQASLYTQFATSKDLESGVGVILNYGQLGKIRINRAGGNNQKFKNYTRAKLAPYTRQIAAGTMDEEVSRALTADIYAKTVILDWEGIRGRNGELLPFTYDNCVQLLADLPDFFDDIQKAAQDVATFRESTQEDIKGN
jgi:hypothetical protein